MGREEVVLYRGPYEAWWWDHPEYYPKLIAIVVVGAIVYWLFNRKKGW